MSTDNRNNRTQGRNDWDAALEEWDAALESNLGPKASSTEEPASSAPPTVRPPAPAPMLADVTGEEDDRTVVGKAPAQLIADSYRSVGKASGLGQMFGRTSPPPVASARPDEPQDMEVLFEEASQPELGGAVASVKSSPADKPDPATLRSSTRRSDAELDAAGAEMLDPVTLRRAATSTGPVTAPPATRSSHTPPVPSSRPVSQALRDQPSSKAPAQMWQPPSSADAVPASSKPEPHSNRVPPSIPSVREPEPTPRPQSAMPPHPSSSESKWQDERDASAYLLNTGTREIWEQRAAWLADEAAARQDVDERSRIMLSVSECCALMGDDEKSVAVATAAREMAPSHPLLHRQARHTALRDRNWDEVLALLEAETKAAPSLDARMHGLLLQASVLLRIHNEPDAAMRLFDTAARTASSDPRAHVEKFVQALVEANDRAPAPQWPQAPQLGTLARAAEAVCNWRASYNGTATGPVRSCYEALPRARSAMASQDLASAGRALRALQPVRGLGAGATWLAAALAGQVAESRRESMHWYDELAAGPHAALARRMLALRAAQLNDASGVAGAVAGSDAAAFSDADRVALGALFGGQFAGIKPSIEALLKEDQIAALGAGAVWALQQPTGEAASTRVQAAGVVSGAGGAALALARQLLANADRDALAERVKALCEQCPESAVARTLDLLLEVEAGRTERLIQEMADWAGGSSQENSERDRALAAAVTAELLQQPDRARDEYLRALAADPSCEVAVRALASLDAGHASERVRELAQAVSDEVRSAVLLLESIWREGEGADPEAAEQLVRDAMQLAPKLPFAAMLGERLARARGEDMDGVLEWLRLRRQAADDPIEAAYDLCREAMLLVERDPVEAAALMAQASAARPSDVGLRDLSERFAQERPADWTQWRLEQLERIDGLERAALAAEAALELERLGQVREAAQLAKQAVDGGAGDVALRCWERCELAGGGSCVVTDALMEQARSEEATVRDRREARERLADIDESGRGDLASALLWHRAILEETPGHLPSLRRLEHAYVGEGRDEDLEPIASELTKLLAGPEVDAHAMLASRIRLRDLPWTQTRDLAQRAAAQPNPSLWALRAQLCHALVADDHAEAAASAQALAARMDRDSERAAMLAIAGRALARAGQSEESRALLSQAVELEERLVDTHLVLADEMVHAGEPAKAADELEKLAAKSGHDEHRVQLWYRAAELWLDKADDIARGRRALEEAADIDLAYGQVFDRLQKLYAETGATTELAVLLERRLELITDPAERVEMEVLRGKALAQVGEAMAAKQALASALDANPDYVPALEAFADLCLNEGDWTGAEQSLIRLARLVPDADKQAVTYRMLGDIYLDHAPDYERAELVLREVLKRKPQDEDAQARLVEVFRRTGDAAKAIELCSTLIESADSPEQKRRHTLQLALIHEQVEGDKEKARSIFERTYKQAPTSIASLQALADFHRRHDEQAALKVLLDRASNDARRALRTGRFNPELFGVLEAVSEQRGNADAAQAARAAVAALEGRDITLAPAGPRACGAELDELLAPAAINESLRALLQRAGDVLDLAFPMDLKALRATAAPPTAADLRDGIVQAAEEMGLTGLEVLVSPALGPTVVPVSSTPARIVLGSSLLTTTEPVVRHFLVLRALKIMQAHASALSRTAPIDLLPMIAAFIKAFAPGFTPTGIDQRRFDESLGRINEVKPASVSSEVGALALELSGSVDNRMSMLNVAVNGWGDRAAFLAVGDLAAALRGIAWAGGHPSGPPSDARERVQWIGRNAEARDLLVFVASDEFLALRQRLGVAEEA